MQQPATKITLRLMPLGGSITYGQGSSDGNGYRKYLHEMLTSDGYHVDLVGSRKAGLMENNANEGWRGYRIEQILNKAQKSVPVYRPNIFTVNAGSNDCLQGFEVDGVGTRMGAMLEYLWMTSPGSTVILSTLLVNADRKTESRVLRVNEQMWELARKLSAEQKRIVAVDMHGDSGPQLCELSDGTHPDDGGYMKIACIWYKGILEAVSKGYLQQPCALPRDHEAGC